MSAIKPSFVLLAARGESSATARPRQHTRPDVPVRRGRVAKVKEKRCLFRDFTTKTSAKRTGRSRVLLLPRAARRSMCRVLHNHSPRTQELCRMCFSPCCTRSWLHFTARKPWCSFVFSVDQNCPSSLAASQETTWTHLKIQSVHSAPAFVPPRSPRPPR